MAIRQLAVIDHFWLARRFQHAAAFGQVAAIMMFLSVPVTLTVSKKKCRVTASGVFWF
jgi:hypothetical protein